jgi:hypothetical protein
MATEHLLGNDNVARLEDMNLLGLLRPVKGGQGTINRGPSARPHPPAPGQAHRYQPD